MRTCKVRTVVTGARSGIGVETARALATTGAEVTWRYATSRPARKLRTGSPLNRLLGGMAAICGRAMDWLIRLSCRFARAWTGPLHVRVNNAGATALPS